MPRVPAIVTLTGDKADVSFEQDIRGITPGQVVAWYENDTLIGGGIISEKK